MIQGVRKCATLLLSKHLRCIGIPLSCTTSKKVQSLNQYDRSRPYSTVSEGFRKSTHVKRTEHTFSTGRVVQTAKAVDDKGWIEVTWTDGLITQHPYVWLRDNCTCEKCFNHYSLSRIFLLKDLDWDIKPISVKVTPDEGCLEVTWPDGHRSTFSSEWLEGRSFTPESKEYRKHWKPLPHGKMWGSDLQDKISFFNFDQLLEDDKVLYDWICTISTVGLAIIKDAPLRTRQIHRLADRISYLHKCNYGETFYVESKENPSNLAYTSGILGLHTDLSYYQASYGCQLLHCISQVPSEGGENLLADGFHAAYILKERHPDLFDILTTTPIEHIDIGTDYLKFFQMSSHPIIGLDSSGNVCHINVSHASRDSYLDMPVEDVTKLYKAIITFTQILYEPKNHITYKLEEGDILCVHNLRVMHGRNSYKILAEGHRRLEGSYLGWDELNSKRRVLSMELDEN